MHGIYWFVKCLTIFLPSSKFVTLCPPQGIFALQKSLRAGCNGGRGSSSQSNAAPAQRNFQRKFALRRVGSHQVCRTPRLQSTQKYVGTLDSVHTVRAGQPGVPEGPPPLCFGRSPEETLSRVSSGQFLRGGSTPRFFAQLRSVGSKNEPAGRSSSRLSLALAATDGKSKKEGRLSPPKPFLFIVAR